MIDVPKRTDNTLNGWWPNSRAGKETHNLDKKSFVGPCRYCGIKTNTYKTLENGVKQPVCGLLCSGLLQEIQELVTKNE